MWTALIVVVLPGCQRRSSVLERRKLGGVQALIAQPPVERLDQRVFNGLARADEIELHALPPGPLVEQLRGELGAVVDGDRLGYGPLPGQPLQGLGDVLPVSENPASSTRLSRLH